MARGRCNCDRLWIPSRRRRTVGVPVAVAEGKENEEGDDEEEE